MLEADVPAPDYAAPRPPCPVCRRPAKVVLARRAGVRVETCATHGVWFGAGDLGPVIEAVAKALGKPAPKVAQALADHEGRPPTTASGSTPATNVTGQPAGSQNAGSVLRPASQPRRLTDPVRDIATGIDDTTGGAAKTAVGVVGDVTEAAVEIVALPFDLTFRAIGGLVDLLGD